MSDAAGGKGVHAHHIAEFGELDDVVHEDKQTDVVSAVATHSAFGYRNARRLRKRVLRKRHLQQHFEGETLYRTMSTRTVSQDELFLDLIIVANIAAIGHELRETFTGWPQLEKFLLLFGAVYSSWRSLIIYWNLWGVSGDVLDKALVYLCFTLLTAVGAGAHAAFSTARAYVSTAAFLATALPLIANAALSAREELLRSEKNIINQQVFSSAVQLVATSPYLIAAFVGDKRVARILFWVPPAAQTISSLTLLRAYRYLHRNRPGFTRTAVNIELMVEKYEVLTLIVLGESLLAILFEAAKFILQENARVGLLYLSILGATALVYSLQTLYVNVDNKIQRGGTHAIRHRALLGFTWSALHLLYHICLVLLATGLGILTRDIIIVAPPSALQVVVRASVPTAGVQFSMGPRWLFSAGWAGSLVLSGLLAATHLASTREKTKRARLGIRGVIAIALGVGMPFTGMKAGFYLLVHALLTAGIALVEYVLVQADALDLFGKKRSATLTNVDQSFDSDEDDSEEEDGEWKTRAADEAQIPASADADAQAARIEECRAARALRGRLNLRSCHRMERVDASDPRRYAVCSRLDIG